MLVDHMLCSIDAARPTELARLMSELYRAHANGALSEDDYMRLGEAIEARRTETRPKQRRPARHGPPHEGLSGRRTGRHRSNGAGISAPRCRAPCAPPTRLI
jgi:hypothetical protein